jgi:NAD(P)H-hydrate epimerase
MEVIEAPPKLPLRQTEAHKGDFGKVCIIAGSLGMTGAAALAGRSALRAGAGLVRVATPRSVLPIVASIEPSFTTIPLAEDPQGTISADAIGAILDILPENDVIAFGPGIGVSPDIRSILETLIRQSGLRLVIDADGLNNLAALRGWPDTLQADLILTPHPGEMRRLWQCVFREQIPDDRAEQATRMASRTGAITVLKGAGTIVTNGKRIYTNSTGNPGMATAGSGDILTGVITALAGQKLSNLDAAVLGVYIHGLAGDIAARQLGHVSLIATDIADALPDAFQDCRS